MAAQPPEPTAEASVAVKRAWGLCLSMAFVVLAAVQVWRQAFDAISLAFLALAASPFVLPVLRGRVRSFEIAGVKVELLELQVRKQEIQLTEQQQIINQLVVYSMAYYLYEMLRNFRRCEQGAMPEYIYRKTDHESRLRYLRDHGYMERTFAIAELRDGENIAGRVKLTPVGRFYVETRENYQRRGTSDAAPAPRTT